MKLRRARWSGRILAACVRLTAWSLFPLSVAAQAVNIPDGSANGFNVPGRAPNSPEAFVPMRAVPQFNPPSSPALLAEPYYQPRVSGVFGFVDPANPSGGGPAYDMEYYLIGRGDGLFLVEATPDPNLEAVVTFTELKAAGTNLRGDFIANPSAMAPYPTPPFTGPAVTHPPTGTGYTAWSECAVLRDPVTGTFYVYGTSGGLGGSNWYFPGLWVVPLTRTAFGLRFNAGAAAPWNPTVAANPIIEIPNVHNITADQDSGLIFVCSNNAGTPANPHGYGQSFFVLTTQFPASYAQPRIRYVYYGASLAGPHDAYVKDGRVFVSHSGGFLFAGMGNQPIGCVDEYQLSDLVATPAMPVTAGPAHRKRYFAPWAESSWNPSVGLDNPSGLRWVHSTYKAGSTMWMLSEIWGYQMGWLQPPYAHLGRANIQPVDLTRDMATGLTPTGAEFQPLMATGRPTILSTNPRTLWEGQQAALGGLVPLQLEGVWI